MLVFGILSYFLEVNSKRIENSYHDISCQCSSICFTCNVKPQVSAGFKLD
jgi:hypothetical protein